MGVFLMAVESIIISVTIVAVALVLLLCMNLSAGNSIWKRVAARQAGAQDGGQAAPNIGRFQSMHRFLNPVPPPADGEGRKPGEGIKDELCQLISHNMTQLDDIYAQTEKEQKNAFNCALVVSFLGFGLLAAGIILAYVRSAEDFAVYSTVGGAIVELISGLFFWIYNKCTKQFDKLYANLIETQKILTSVQLISRVGEEKKDGAYLGIVDHIMEHDATAHRAKKPKPAGQGANPVDTAPTGTTPS
jgi:hypothetical protein